MGCEGGGDGIRTTPAQERHEDELPSVALTTKFLALRRQYGSEHLAVGIMSVGRGTGCRVASEQPRDGVERRPDRPAFERLQQELDQ